MGVFSEEARDRSVAVVERGESRLKGWELKTIKLGEKLGKIQRKKNPFYSDENLYKDINFLDQNFKKKQSRAVGKVWIWTERRPSLAFSMSHKWLSRPSIQFPSTPPPAPWTLHFFIPSLLACQAAVNKCCVDRVKVEFWPLTLSSTFPWCSRHSCKSQQRRWTSTIKQLGFPFSQNTQKIQEGPLSDSATAIHSPSQRRSAMKQSSMRCSPVWNPPTILHPQIYWPQSFLLSKPQHSSVFSCHSTWVPKRLASTIYRDTHQVWTKLHKRAATSKPAGSLGIFYFLFTAQMLTQLLRSFLQHLVLFRKRFVFTCLMSRGIIWEKRTPHQAHWHQTGLPLQFSAQLKRQSTDINDLCFYWRISWLFFSCESPIKHWDGSPEPDCVHRRVT